ncbi:choloylglycine hydrolase family protein [Flammeovirga sp. MY04]|uniref:linear amide C-N hydrolase n=1 Tax=Flammeovirga sp. MY04 TaxID=1191459 RepID=UPI0013053AC9|nr:choloylglycine hydrolase family protein [Flammeovirga sp. MY04]ANQ51914.2 choloylglycine hydrolase family protein [Flammeovirga sp. MY04]
MTVQACTGIRLIAEDGSVVYGRTLEWGAFDLNTKLAIIPRGKSFTGSTPDGKNGKEFKTQYGFVGMTLFSEEFYGDGINEAGLAGGGFFHPGYAKYQEYKKENADNSISAVDMVTYVLGNFKDVEEVKNGMKEIDVVGVFDEQLGIEIPGHWIFSDITGASVVIEFTDGELKLYDSAVGVITNAPNYDWHLTNLSNYINLTPFPHAPKQLGDFTVRAHGAGSGFLGLPGDNTPASRFVRAAVYSQTARNTATANETVYELFRILDNFNIPLGPDGAEGASEDHFDDSLRSATLWTSVANTKDKQYSYHTQHNRRVRMIDLKEINFAEIGNEVILLELDPSKEQDIQKIEL